jgi:hypothetical protein
LRFGKFTRKFKPVKWRCGMIEMGIHDEANIFPMMNAAEFEALKGDIKANGLKKPIVVHEGKILDGRNRLRACVEVGVEPKFEEWDQKGDQFDFVIGANIIRRHLSKSQKALIAYEMVKRKAVTAKGYTGAERSVGDGTEKDSGDGKSGKSKNKHDCEAAERAAKLCCTNRQYVTDVKRIAEEAPEKLDEIKSGRKTIPQIKRDLTKAEIKGDPCKRGKIRTKSSKFPTLAVDTENAPPLETLARFLRQLCLSHYHGLIPDEDAKKLCEVLKSHVASLGPSLSKSLAPSKHAASRNKEDFNERKADDHASGRGTGSGDAGKPNDLAGRLPSPDSRGDSGSGSGGASTGRGSEDPGRG